MPFVVLLIFSYAIYRMAESNNITPWKWVIRYVATIIGTYLAIIFMAAVVIVATNANPQNLVNDKAFIQKLNDMSIQVMSFELLYEFGIFFLFRMRISKYVNQLDQLEKINNNPNSVAEPPKKDDKDLSYFR